MGRAGRLVPSAYVCEFVMMMMTMINLREHAHTDTYIYTHTHSHIHTHKYHTYLNVLIKKMYINK